MMYFLFLIHFGSKPYNPITYFTENISCVLANDVMFIDIHLPSVYIMYVL